MRPVGGTPDPGEVHTAATRWSPSAPTPRGGWRRAGRTAWPSSTCGMSPDLLAAERIEIDGRTATFRVGGDGPPVLFLHGWGLGTRAYQRVVRRLARRGCRVYAPAMPGFGGTADLPGSFLSIEGYSEWVEHFMHAVHIDEPALVIGHSFGGGVAIKLAQAHPDRVGYLVLLNSVGGVTTRPVWAWLLQFARELFPNRQGIEIALGDARRPRVEPGPQPARPRTARATSHAPSTCATSWARSRSAESPCSR